MKSIQYLLLLMMIAAISCNTSAQQQDPIPQHETFTINSAMVGEERVINVWMPAAYANSSEPLPVMYMADGGIKEDFPHIANTLEKLIKEKKIKPIILVGIENTQRRRDLTGYTEVEKDKAIAPVVGGSQKFRAFIKEELFPEINKRYRTKAEKSIIGESASGLFVMETFFLDPGMFDHYIAFDPSLWWNNHYLVRSAKEHLAKFPASEKKLWFAASNTKDIAPHNKQLAEILKKENPSHLKWQFSNEPKEKHNTIFRATKEKAFIWALN